MSNRFTEKAEKALNSTTSIAQSLGHAYIGSEHILLSLSKSDESLASKVLIKHGAKADVLRDKIKEYSGTGAKSTLSPKDMTPRCRKIIENSYRISLRYGAEKIGTEHILLSILEEKDCIAMKILGILNVDITKITDEIVTVLRTAERHFEIGKIKKEAQDSPLMQYGKNLTEAARCGKLDPVIGRDKETERMIRILSRKTKNNPCLIGEAGVGKTAIVEGLTERIAKGNVPPALKGKSIISVDLTSMVAGAKYRGDFEDRIKNILSEATKNNSVILFIDEIHTIVGAGAAEGAIDAANILKPQLSRGEIQLIGATTFAEYHKFIEKDSALERRFQPLTVEEPDEKRTIEILNGLKERYEAHHNVIIDNSAIGAAVSLSKRFIQDRYFPDKAIDVIDEACAKASVFGNSNDNELQNIEEKIQQIERDKESAVKSKNYDIAISLREKELEYRERLDVLSMAKNAISPPMVTENEVREIIHEITGIPINGIYEHSETEHLESRLKSKIYGQDEAIEKLVSAVMRSETGINSPDRPKGVFLFTGASGVGKTELAKALAVELFRDKRALIRYDMSEFSEKNSVSMMIGSPPGYVGYEEGGSLTEKIKRRPYSLILFDEIEKAHRDVLNLFLQIMDDGILTDSSGRSVSFKNTYIIMTSNAITGSNEEGNVGFLSNLTQENKNKRLYEFFSPEFINRIDSVIHFSSLTKSSAIMITEAKLNDLKGRLAEKGITMEFSKKVSDHIATEGLKQRLGARSLLRIISSEIENVISANMLRGALEKIEFDVIDNKISSVINKNKSNEGIILPLK